MAHVMGYQPAAKYQLNQLWLLNLHINFGKLRNNLCGWHLSGDGSVSLDFGRDVPYRARSIAFVCNFLGVFLRVHMQSHNEWILAFWGLPCYLQYFLPLPWVEDTNFFGLSIAVRVRLWFSCVVIYSVITSFCHLLPVCLLAIFRCSKILVFKPFQIWVPWKLPLYLSRCFTSRHP